MGEYVFIPGAASDSWYWHLLADELRSRGHRVATPELRCDDDAAGLPEYADTVAAAIGDRTGTVLVAHSFGGFTAPLVSQRASVDRLVLLSAMIGGLASPLATGGPTPGYGQAGGIPHERAVPDAHSYVCVVAGPCYRRNMTRRRQEMVNAELGIHQRRPELASRSTGVSPGRAIDRICSRVGSPARSDMLALQSAAGNGAVAMLLGSSPGALTVQRQPLTRPPIEVEMGGIGQLLPPAPPGLDAGGQNPRASAPAPPRPSPVPPAGRQAEAPTGPSPELVYFLMRQEGFYARPDDVSDRNNCTIGYGTLIHRGPCDGTEPARFTRGISREQGLAMLMDRLIPIVNSVRSRVTAVLGQNQFDALVDFAYTTGPNSNLLGNLIRLANAGNNTRVGQVMRQYTGAATPDGRIVHPGGLVRRRGEEATMWEGGGYGHGAPGYHRGCRRMVENCPRPRSGRRR